MKYPIILAAVFFSVSGCKHASETRPQRKEIVDAVFGSGHIENRDQYAVMANQEGYLRAVLVAEGDSIRRDQVLYRMDANVQETQAANAMDNLRFAKTNAAPVSPQIGQLEVQINQAKAKAYTDSLNYARYQRLVLTHAVSESDMENVRVQYTASASNVTVLEKNLRDLRHTLDQNVDNAKAQHLIQEQTKDYYSIRAKADGIVFNLVKKVGDYVKKGEQLAEVGAGVSIIKLYVAEEDIRRVSPGQAVLISLNSDKTQVYKASVTKVYPMFDETQQAFVVEAAFVERPAVLINGTQLQGNIILEDKKDALVIPSYYVMPGDFVQIKGRSNKVSIKTGIKTLEWTEVTGGLQEQDVLVQPKSE